MGIKVNLDEMLHQRRMTLTELSGRVGISLTNLSILKNGRSKGIRFSTLSSICSELDCEPGDILARDHSSLEGED
ncbi:helix-turn-helix domain-containing protein [Erythrobacter crassostreae]|uniref:Helix-turn-helix transcriptional regulator n=1 Tax=Erythrobacter crassostreae TaxID=2828328 RepID=A0A9X1F5L0_9SPHN|nr:helix-turn-helix transcriptional regulator [Erythrobacter crassostrea]MBV7260314.1 helix-turn-helix transcriptional regulator [Erythrobacter crassostrea]